MNDSYFDPLWVKKISLPVKRVGKNWEFFYGGDVPVNEGALGLLTVNADQITDKEFKERVTREISLRVLEQGTELRVALSDHSARGKIVGTWPDRKEIHNVPPAATRMVSVYLGPMKREKRRSLFPADDDRGGLWIRLSGMEKSELLSGNILLPEDLDSAPAQSLNHMLTILSERYEGHRISHTGNVYRQVFYQEPNGHWYPIQDLREGALAKAERKLLDTTWREIARLLNLGPDARKSPVSREQAIRIAQGCLEKRVKIPERNCHASKPDNVNVYGDFSMPCWWVFVPWQDGMEGRVLRSSRIIVIDKRTGEVRHDGSAGDEG